jgi:hypothetical protein
MDCDPARFVLVGGVLVTPPAPEIECYESEMDKKARWITAEQARI